MDVSIIIPSHNTKKLLKLCLRSVFRETKKVKFEVIVVDNHSRDGSVQMVRKNFPKVNLVELDKNLGFGKANNLGAQKARGNWLLFLNSDTQILDGAVDKLLEKPAASIVGCQLLNSDGSIQPSVGYFPNLIRVILQMLFLDDLPLVKKFVKPYQQDDKNFYKKEHEVDWVTGAFLLVKRNLFEKIGGFDEEFFMYAEEVDLCYRLKKQNAKVIYSPKAQVMHTKGGSSSDGFRAAIVGEYRGLVSFFVKHKSAWQLPILENVLKLGALLRIGVFAIVNRRKVRVYSQAMSEISN